jgi:hypothetical protein
MPDTFWNALPSVVGWLVFALFLWTQHVQYLAGHETIFFVHKTPEEKRIREALVKKMENAVTTQPASKVP